MKPRRRTVTVDHDKLSKLMDDKGLSWERLARLAGRVQSTIARMLSGELVDLGSVADVAKVFNLEAKDLYDLKQPSSNDPSSACPSEGAIPVPQSASPQPPAGSADSPREAPNHSADNGTATDGQDLTHILMHHRPKLVVGDRRQTPARGPADILLSPGWTDFCQMGRLPNLRLHKMIPDTYLADDWLSETGMLNNDSLLSCGGADVNFATLLLNANALFRFLVPNAARVALLNHFRMLRALPAERDQRLYMSTHDDELRQLRRQLSPESIGDPITGISPTSCRAGEAYGLVTFALHYSGDLPCIVAAGVTGPTTAAAIALLSGESIWDPVIKTYSGLDTRPAGGVFRRRPSKKSPPHDVLEVEKDCEWITPPYTLGALTNILQKWPAHGNMGLTQQDAERLQLGIQTFLARPEHIEPAESARFAAILPTGGRSTRMATLVTAHNVQTKLALPVATPNGPRTVLELSLGALAKSGLVESANMVSTSQHLDSQRALAQEFSSPSFDVSVMAEGDQGFFGALVAATLHAHEADRWVALMMPDVLLPPTAVEKLLRNAVRDHAPVAVVTTEVSVAEGHRYGIAMMCGGRVHRIVEKPGQASDSHAFCGFAILSPAVAPLIKGFVDRYPYERRDIVALLNHLAKHVPVLRYSTEQKTWDCGSPDGYADACKDASEISVLWGID